MAMKANTQAAQLPGKKMQSHLRDAADERCRNQSAARARTTRDEPSLANT